MDIRAILKNRRKCALWIGVAVLLVVLAAFLRVGSTRVVVNEHEAHLPHLAPAADGLRVAVVSDPHFGSGDAGRAAMLAEKINRTDPDLILLLGDFVNGDPDLRRSISMAELTRFVGSLRARIGVFAVTGNHELWYGRDKVVSALREGGATVLVNESVTTTTPSGDPLQIVGLPDFSTEEHPQAFPEVRPGLPTLIMMHDPRSANFVPQGIDGFIVAGHTHGGQLRILPGGGERTSLRLAVVRIRNSTVGLPPEQHPYVLFDRGFTEYRGRRMFITSGLGLSRLPLRLFCPPEVVLFKFRSAPDAARNTFTIPEEL